MKLAAAFVIAAFIFSSYSQGQKSSAASQLPQKTKLFRHHGTTVWSCGSGGVNGLVYKAGLAVDADGAFRAYNPKNRLGLDTIAHAGHAGDWWALATDTGKASGRPVLQGKNDPAPGYYVSMTALFDAGNLNERDPRRFVDSVKVPYIVLPTVALRHAKLGDFATVVNLRNGKVAGAIVADESGRGVPMGEGSIALAKALGIDSDPRTGGIEHGVAYVIYAGSGNGKPRGVGEIRVNSQEHFQAWGGAEQLGRCLR